MGHSKSELMGWKHTLAASPSTKDVMQEVFFFKATFYSLV